MKVRLFCVEATLWSKVNPSLFFLAPQPIILKLNLFLNNKTKILLLTLLLTIIHVTPRMITSQVATPCSCKAYTLKIIFRKIILVKIIGKC